MPNPYESPEYDPPPLGEEVRQGRTILLSVFISFLSIDLVIISYKTMGSGFNASISSYVRICLTACLMYAVWIGKEWARWLFVVLTVAATLLAISTVISTWQPLAIAMLVVFAASAALVGFHPGVLAFLRYQRELDEQQRK